MAQRAASWLHDEPALLRWAASPPLQRCYCPAAKTAAHPTAPASVRITSRPAVMYCMLALQGPQLLEVVLMECSSPRSRQWDTLQRHSGAF